MGEDFDNHPRIFDACPERVEGAAMIFKLPPQFGQCSMSISKTHLSSLAQLKTIPAAANWREHFKHLAQPR
jgi:hypothetical protein